MIILPWRLGQIDRANTHPCLHAGRIRGIDKTNSVALGSTPTAAAQLTDQDDFGATCTTETQAVLACAQKTCPEVTVGAVAPWTQDSCSIPGCDTSTCFGIKKCGIVSCRAEIKFDRLVDA